MASLAELYAERMKCHPFGLALYHPASSHDLRPGSVGFFDSLGRWTPIAHLEQSDTLSKYDLRFPIQPLTTARTERIKGWTPKVGTGTTERSGGVNLGASSATTGLPADASLRVEYGTSSDSGAVLITSSPVTRNGYHYQSPFKTWVKANAKALLHGSIGDDIKENGLFVVTQTYATEKVALTAWKNAENKAYFGFGVGATGLGEISPNMQWYTGSSESGWNVHEAEPGELKVVFVGGLAYRRLWSLSNQLHRTNSPTRGASRALTEDRIVISEPGSEHIELECQIFGIPFEKTDDDDEDDEISSEALSKGE